MGRGIKHKGKETVGSFSQRARTRAGEKKGGRGTTMQPVDSSGASSDSRYVAIMALNLIRIRMPFFIRLGKVSRIGRDSVRDDSKNSWNPGWVKNIDFLRRDERIKTMASRKETREKGASRGKMRKPGKDATLGKLALAMWCLRLGEDGAGTRSGEDSTMVTSRNEIREVAALAIPVGNSAGKTERKNEELHRIKRIEKRVKRRNLPGVVKNRARVLLFRPPGRVSIAKFPYEV